MGWSSISTEEYIWVVFSCFSALVYGLIIYIIAVHGLLLFFTVNFVMRPRKFRLIIYPITDDSRLVEWTYYWYSFLKNNLFLSYIVVAANRMTVFIFETNYKRMWTPTVVCIITACCYVFLLFLRFLTYSSSYKFATTVDFAADIFMFALPPAMDLFDIILDIVLSLGSGTICLVLYLITAYRAKRSNITGNKKKREMIILRSAFVTFLLMLPAAIRGAIHCYAISFNDTELRLMSNRAATYFIEVMFVAEPWVLIMTFHSIRQKVVYLFGSVALSGSVIENSVTDAQNASHSRVFTVTR